MLAAPFYQQLCRLLVFVLSYSPFQIIAQNNAQPDLTGSWKGEIRVGDLVVSFETEMVKNGDGSYCGITDGKVEQAPAGFARFETKKTFYAVLISGKFTHLETKLIWSTPGSTVPPLAKGEFQLIEKNGVLFLEPANKIFQGRLMQVSKQYHPEFHKLALSAMPEDYFQTPGKIGEGMAPLKQIESDLSATVSNQANPTSRRASGKIVTQMPPKGRIDQTKVPKSAIEEWLAGVKLVENGKHAQAIDSFIAAGSKGFAVAAFQVGLMLNLNWAIKENFPLAAKWYRFAAENGIPGAKAKLGVLAYRGDPGITKDTDYSFQLSKLAFKEGCSFASVDIMEKYFLKRNFSDSLRAQLWKLNYDNALSYATNLLPTKDLAQRFMAAYAQIKSESGLDLANILLGNNVGIEYDPNALSISNIRVTGTNGPDETEYEAEISNRSDGSFPTWHFRVNRIFVDGGFRLIVRPATVGEIFALTTKKVDFSLDYPQQIIHPGFDDLLY